MKTDMVKTFFQFSPYPNIEQAIVLPNFFSMYYILNFKILMIIYPSYHRDVTYSALYMKLKLVQYHMNDHFNIYISQHKQIDYTSI